VDDPSPRTSPAFLSLAKKYRGWPPSITCSFPSVRFVVPSIEARRPEPTVGLAAISGGQTDAHFPSQALLPPVSAVNRYSVRPLAATSTFPACVARNETVDVVVEANAAADATPMAASTAATAKLTLLIVFCPGSRSVDR
jgi:hypothetical protein